MGNIMWKEIKSEKDIELFMREVVSLGRYTIIAGHMLIKIEV